MRFQQIYDWIEANKPEVVLEVGTWNGNNARLMFKEGVKKYIGFDIWEDGDESLDELENNAKKRVSLSEAQEKLKDFDVELIKGNTRNTLKEYVKDKKPFVDMAIIDGGHSKGTIKSDLLNCFKIVKPEGVIFIDDYYFNSPKTNIGAQSVLGDISVPYTVLPKAEKANDGAIIKVVKIEMRHVPRNDWEVPEEQSWKFEPEAA